MIEKLDVINSGINVIDRFGFTQNVPVARIYCNKINEIIDIINAITIDVDGTKCVDGSKAPADNSEKANCQGSVLTMVDNQVTANLPNIDAGELAFLSKENSELKDEIDRLKTDLERTRKALEIAVDALKTVRRYTAINQFAPKSREAHIVAKKALAEITAPEQKDVK